MTRAIANSFKNMFITSDRHVLRWLWWKQWGNWQTFFAVGEGPWGRGTFKCREMLWQWEERQEYFKKKRKKEEEEKKYYLEPQAGSNSSLRKCISSTLLKTWTHNTSDHWFAIFLILALLFPYESNSLLSFRVWFDRYCSHFTFVFSSSYTITHWVPREITIVHFQLSNPFAVQKIGSK